MASEELLARELDVLIDLADKRLRSDLCSGLGRIRPRIDVSATRRLSRPRGDALADVCATCPGTVCCLPDGEEASEVRADLEVESAFFRATPISAHYLELARREHDAAVTMYGNMVRVSDLGDQAAERRSTNILPLMCEIVLLAMGTVMFLHLLANVASVVGLW